MDRPLLFVSKSPLLRFSLKRSILYTTAQHSYTDKTKQLNQQTWHVLKYVFLKVPFIGWTSKTLRELLIPSSCNLKSKLHGFYSNELAQRDDRAFAGCSSMLELLSRTNCVSGLLQKLWKLKRQKCSEYKVLSFQKHSPTQIQLWRGNNWFSHIKCTATRETFVEFYLRQQDFWVIFIS